MLALCWQAREASGHAAAGEEMDEADDSLASETDSDDDSLSPYDMPEDEDSDGMPDLMRRYLVYCFMIHNHVVQLNVV